MEHKLAGLEKHTSICDVTFQKTARVDLTCISLMGLGLLVEVMQQLITVFQQISLLMVSAILSFVVELSERLNRCCG